MARVSIEDCLEFMDNRFALVKVAAQRARELIGGAEPLRRTKNKECVTALREIADGLVKQKGHGQAPVTEPEAPVASAPAVEAVETPAPN